MLLMVSAMQAPSLYAGTITVSPLPVTGKSALELVSITLPKSIVFPHPYIYAKTTRFCFAGSSFACLFCLWKSPEPGVWQQKAKISSAGKNFYADLISTINCNIIAYFFDFVNIIALYSDG